MKKFITALAFCLLVAFAAAPARAEEDPALKKEIEARYAAFAEASEKADGMKVMAMMAPGYTNTDLAGTVRTAHEIAGAVTTALPDDGRKSATTVTSLKKDGDKVTVGQTYELTTIRKAAEGGGTIDYRMVTTSTDTWVKLKGEWLLEKAEAGTGDVFIDGNRVSHRVRGEKTEPAAGAAETPAEKAPAAQ